MPESINRIRIDASESSDVINMLPYLFAYAILSEHYSAITLWHRDLVHAERQLNLAAKFAKFNLLKVSERLFRRKLFKNFLVVMEIPQSVLGTLSRLGGRSMFSTIRHTVCRILKDGPLSKMIDEPGYNGENTAKTKSVNCVVTNEKC